MGWCFKNHQRLGFWFVWDLPRRWIPCSCSGRWVWASSIAMVMRFLWDASDRWCDFPWPIHGTRTYICLPWDRLRSLICIVNVGILGNPPQIVEMYFFVKMKSLKNSPWIQVYSDTNVDIDGFKTTQAATSGGVWSELGAGGKTCCRAYWTPFTPKNSHFERLKDDILLSSFAASMSFFLGELYSKVHGQKQTGPFFGGGKSFNKFWRSTVLAQWNVAIFWPCLGIRGPMSLHFFVERSAFLPHLGDDLGQGHWFLQQLRASALIRQQPIRRCPGAPLTVERLGSKGLGLGGVSVWKKRLTLLGLGKWTFQPNAVSSETQCGLVNVSPLKGRFSSSASDLLFSPEKNGWSPSTRLVDGMKFLGFPKRMGFRNDSTTNHLFQPPESLFQPW